MSEIYSKADTNIKQLVNEYGDSCKVKSSKLKKDEYGRKVSEGSYYELNKKTIYMNELKDNEEYAITFCHEFGHYVDNMMGDASLGENFDYAIEADRDWIDLSKAEGVEMYKTMLTELSKSSVIDSRYVSDILSGVFNNNSLLQVTYNAKGRAFCGHKTSYWQGDKKNEKPVNREIFADLFGIYSENDSEVIAFTEKWFPNVTARFKKIISEGT